MKYSQLLQSIDSASQRLLGRAAAVVNQSLVIRNWLVGACIVEFEQRGDDRARYGERLMESLAADLQERGLRGLSVPMLGRMRRFYQVYPQLAAGIPSPLVTGLGVAADRWQARDSVTTGDRIGRRVVAESTDSAELLVAAPLVRRPGGKQVSPLSAKAVLQLSWSQLIELIRIDDPLKRAFYENECLRGNWSKRQLQRQIGSLLFERTGLSTDKPSVIERGRKQAAEAQAAEAPLHFGDLIRDPYILEFTGLAELPAYQESELEQALLNHLQTFLLELGTGFCFEARQKRITVGTKHDYIDLVFYQRRLRCHVLLDLKVRSFEHGDAGQMNFYLNWWKKHGMEKGDRPPVGIVLCSDREKAGVEFATAGLSNKLFVSRYLVVLPSADQLRAFLEKDRAQVESLIALPPAGAKARPFAPRFALPTPSPGRKASARARRLRKED